MKHFKYKLLASFLSALIILLPFYVSDVYATGLTINKASGEDKVNGYRKKLDKTIIDVDAAVDGDDSVSKEQLKVSIDDGPIEYPFTSCTYQQGYSQCLYSKLGDVTADTHTYDVLMYDDSETLLLTRSVEISVDNLGPKVVSLEANPAVTTTGEVSIDYTVHDYAYTEGEVSKCTGIKKIEFYKDDFSGSPIKTIEPITEDCVVSGSVDYKAGEKDETVLICAKAEDMFKQSSTEIVCSSFRVDKSAPEIDNLEIRDKAGNAIVYVAKEVPAEVTVDLEEEELELDSITADLSALNAEANYQNKKADSCLTTDAITTCTWNVNIKLTKSVSAQIKVSAADKAGNTATETFTKELTYDSLGPVVVQIETDRGLYRGTGYAGSTTTFIAYVLEKGIGIGNGDIYLDLSEIGLGNNVKADECMLGVDGWECYWYDKKVNAQDGLIVTILSTANSKDDLGNLAVGIFGAEFVVDSSPPVVEFVNLTTIHGAMAYDEHTIKGDSLDIAAYVNEPTSVSATADLSGLISYGEDTAGECSYTGTNWKCEWHTKPIDVSGPYTANINLEFEDFVGNKATKTETIQVVGLSNDTSPNYWKNEVSCAPSKIDRQVTTLVNQRVYCHVKLQAQHAGQNPETLSISLGDCQDARNSSSLDYVRSVGFMNDFAGSTDPYLKVTLKTTSMEINNLGIVCDLSIISKVGDYITPYSETEEVSVTIPFYNLPLGEYSDNVQQKIKDAEDAATGSLWKLIGGLGKFLEYAKFLCNLAATINHAVTVMADIYKVISSAETVSTVFGGKSVLYGPRVAQGSSTELLRESSLQILEMVEPFCNFVNCKAGKVLETDEGLAKWGKTLGGGGGIRTIENWGDVPWVTPDWFEKYTGKKAFGPGGYMNVKDSIVLSIATFCVPGVIYNLNKYRQIECMYADCLQKSVDSGVPIKVCEDQKEYATCKYFVGEIFKVLPITAIFDYYTRMARNVLADPLSTAGLALGLVCRPSVVLPDSNMYIVCAWGKLLSEVGYVANNIMSFIDSGEWTIREDYCDRIEEKKEKEEEEEEGYFG